jgi:hypothetical protein
VHFDGWAFPKAAGTCPFGDKGHSAARVDSMHRWRIDRARKIATRGVVGADFSRTTEKYRDSAGGPAYGRYEEAPSGRGGIWRHLRLRVHRTPSTSARADGGGRFGSRPQCCRIANLVRECYRWQEAL